MLPLPSTRTGAKSGAIFAALGEICGLVVRKIVSACPTPHDLACSPSALERYGKPEIFNTDQGNPFTGPNRTDMLKASGIQISMDGEGRWLDNVLIERLWRSLERECVYLNAFDWVRDRQVGIGAWMDYYNRKRTHSSLGDLTPG